MTVLPDTLKKSIRRKVSLLLAISSISIALSSCSVFESPQTPIRIGINAWPGYEFLYLADVKGFYEREGVPVQIVEFDSLSDGKRAYERGNIDALACTLIEHLQILENSPRNPMIAAVADYSNGADVALMKTEAGQPKSLKGATVGLESESLGVYMLFRLLEREGLSLDDVKLESVNQSVMRDWFCEDRIDVAITYPPTSIHLTRDCGASEIFSSEEIPGEVVDIIVFDQSLLHDRPEDVESVLKAFFDAQEWAFDNKEEAFAIMGEREGVTAEEFAEALSDGLFVVGRSEQAGFFSKGGLLDKAIEKCNQVLRETGQLNGPERHQSSIVR